MNNPPKIIYIYDALCGWCYGFSPVMKNFYEENKEEFDFEVLSGGMVMGDRVGPISNIADYLKDAYKVVEERANVAFGQPFLDAMEEGSMVLSSEKPAIAMAIFKQEQPKQAIQFAHRLQKALYSEGLDLNTEDTYKALFNEFGLHGEQLIQRFSEQTIIDQVNAEFQQVSDFGVTGFPTVLAEVDGKYYVLARGYVDSEQLEKAVQQLKTLTK